MCFTRLEKQIKEQLSRKLFSVSSEINAILDTRFLGNKW